METYYGRVDSYLFVLLLPVERFELGVRVL